MSHDPDFDAWNRPSSSTAPQPPIVVAPFGRQTAIKQAERIQWCACGDEPRTSICRRKIIDSLPPLCELCGLNDSTWVGCCAECAAEARERR